jgi:hypothetical protein
MDSCNNGQFEDLENTSELSTPFNTVYKYEVYYYTEDICPRITQSC